MPGFIGKPPDMVLNQTSPLTLEHDAHHRREGCRVCGSKKLRVFLKLGPMPLANSFLDSPDEFTGERLYPLDVFFCENCGLVQLLDVIDPEVLFRNYIYVTGTSDTINAHNVEYARTVAGRLNLRPTDLVVEIASNDGSLLKAFRRHNVRTLGIEPASNIAELSRSEGIETIDRFFNSALGSQIRNEFGAARAVIANNVLAHVDDPVDLLRGFREMLSQDGLISIEVPYLRDLLERLEYDTIYHEHLSYFSAAALLRLCETAGLSFVDLDHVSVHGGSLRMYAGLPEHFGGHSPRVRAWVEEEKRLAMTSFDRYQSFAEGVSLNRRALLELLRELRDQGKTIAGYGAPAKGNTLLNYCGIGVDLLSYTVDKNPLKVGTFTPGMHIPVLPVSTLLERQPDYVLILAWNFAEEIMRQQHEYIARGGHFITPLPEPRIY